MGNCCGGSERKTMPTTAKMEIRRQKGQLKIHGDYFCSVTRTILACLDYCGVPYTLEEVDTFQGEHKEEKYLELNPTGQVPTIEHDKTVVLGDYSAFLNFLANQYHDLGSQLYPDKSVNDIKTHLLWYKCIMRPATQRFIRHIVGPKAFGEREYSSEEKQANQREIWELILPKMEEFLNDKQRNFMCSQDNLTIVDIQYYNELQ